MLRILEENKELQSFIADIKYIEARLEKNSGRVRFIFVCRRELTRQERDTLEAQLKKHEFGGYDFSCELLPDNINESILVARFGEYIKKEFYALYNGYSESDLGVSRLSGEKGYRMVYKVRQENAAIIEELKLKSRAEEYFGNITFAPVHVEIEKGEEEVSFSSVTKSIEENQVKLRLETLSKPDKVVRVNKLEKITGKAVTGKPVLISEIGGAGEKAVVCGSVTDIKMLDFSGKGYHFECIYKGSVKDPTGSISFSAFVSGEERKGWEKVREGEDVVVYGKLVNDSLRGNLNLNVYAAQYCEITGFPQQVIKNRIPFDDYLIVKPEAYITQVQQNFFERSENEIPECLRGREFVFVDFETTGLYESDRIVEIGAVKMRDGRIIEQFQTLVNPEMSIPAEASKINNIYDKDVETAPKLVHVIGDFYKFGYGSIMVAHNAEFDRKVLEREAYRVRYEFTNKWLDTLQLAKEFFSSKERGGVPFPRDYKLSTLTKVFGIEYQERHRALSDICVTAEVFVKIAQINPGIIKNALQTLA